MPSADEDRRSDRSLFSMLVDAAVSSPERHEQILGQIPAKGELFEAVALLKNEFGRVPWQPLNDAEQIKALEQIQERIRGNESSAGELAARALHWGLQNRTHRRPRAVARSANSPAFDELEFDKLF
jgi:hypothetical protein